ncbi:MAG: topoisomerase C-terminal repeat-containing protein [Clostridia bacterium]|nr:topoisomerase C-terminal repeat-containing protein [Clostridia bacterium]
MYLIIAEKPSLARNIIAGIAKLQNDEMKKYNGYYEGGSYVVSWVFGHLFSLADIEDYSPTPDGRWTMDNIPCFPKSFKFNLRRNEDKTVDSGVEKQFNIIKRLCNRSDIDTIVNAGDSDREGEIIVRLCVMHALSAKKNFVRLWLPDQTPETISAGLQDMKDESEYDNLANEGFARTYIDWLYGVNLTRFATLKTGKLLRVGRVIVPIVKAIYDRDLEIRSFTPQKYYVISSHEMTNGEYVDLTSKKKFTAQELNTAQAMCDEYNKAQAIVTDVKTKKDKLSPPKLFSLSKLQSYLGKKYKMSMDDSLNIVQKLYEEGYVTYPRTNSEYLATAEQGKIKSIIGSVQKLGYPVKFKFAKSIFDDSKIESHSALTPTYKIPSPSALSDKEKQVYSTILRRFVAVFCDEECLCEKSEIKISVGSLEDFVLKGTVITQKGWTRFDDYTPKDKILPKLAKGDIVTTCFKPQEKETAPPKHYTIETLNNYLKNPFKEDKQNADESDDEDYKAIFEGLELGTEATRTGIIENACKSQYIQLKKDVYHIMPDGEYLIEALSELGIIMDKYKTSQLGQSLKRVFRGECTIDDSVQLAENEIQAVFDIATQAENNIGVIGDVIGKCPVCGGDVIGGRMGYGCSRYKEGCKFVIWKHICKRPISLTHARALLENGQTERIFGFLSKNNKRFSAILKLDGDKVAFDGTEFENPVSDGETAIGQSVGKCPVCGGTVVTTRFGYGCDRYKDGCKFTISREICKREITVEDVTEILTNGKTKRLNGFVSKAGNSFEASLKLEGDKVVFDFNK